jgi:TolA-binding protein
MTPKRSTAGGLLALVLKTGPMFASMLVAGSAIAAEGEVAAPSGSERAEPAPADLEAMRAASERLAARSQEFVRDTQDFVDRREVDEKRRLARGYDLKLSALEEAERTQRLLAIEKFEDFLERHDTSEYSSHVRFRLAELYFDEASDAWLDGFESYDQRVAIWEAASDEQKLNGDVEDPGEPPLVDLSRCIPLYERIIADNKKLPAEERYEYLDATYYALAFAHSDDKVSQYDPERAKFVFDELIAEFPRSDLADAAHMFRGNYLFYKGRPSFTRQAVVEYEAVYKRGPESKEYVKALYQLAWARYKLSDYDEAMRLFTELLDLDAKAMLVEGKGTGFAPDATHFLARSFADIAEDAQTFPDRYGGALTADYVGRQWFSKVGSRDYEWDVFFQLKGITKGYDRPAEAMEVLRHLQSDERWKNRPENPELQMELVQMLLEGLRGDPTQSAAERLLLTQRYGIGSEWWNANRNNPDAQAVARKFIEESLLDVAVEYHVQADKTKLPGDFLLAAEKYREYLDKFPIADDYYEQQWYLADTLRQGGRAAEAEAEYASLVKTASHHPYGDSAIYNLTAVRYQRVLDEVGPFQNPDPNATVERTYQTPSGKEIQVRTLSDVHKRFIEIADAFAKHTFTEPKLDIVPDYRPLVQERTSSVLYLPGQLLFLANRFDEARPRLLQVIETLPQTDEAAYAASYIVQSYVEEGDPAMVRRYTQRFVSLGLGGSSQTIAAKEAEFKDRLERSTYVMAEDLQKIGKNEEAAKAFLAFIEEFPNSQFNDRALLLAASNYEQMGRSGEANVLFERFIMTYPNHPDAKQYFFRIGENYERRFEFNKAIALYDSAYQRFPEGESGAYALYQASFLRLGIGEYRKAAEGFEEYARKYPTLSDREEQLFRAGPAYERHDERNGTSLAIEFYRRYLRDWGTAVPGHAVQAQNRIAELLAAAGNDREAAKAREAMLALYDRILAEGGKVEGVSLDAVAAVAFAPIQAEFNRITKDKLVRDDKKDAAVLTRKADEVPEFRASVSAFWRKYPSFEYTTAALYLEAEALAYWAELGLSVQPPEGLSDDEAAVIYEILEESLYPEYRAIEDDALTLFQRLVDLAGSQKRWSSWVSRAQAAQNRIRPAEFPAAKPEVRANGVVRPPPVITPIPPDSPWFKPPEPAPSPANGGGGSP